MPHSNQFVEFLLEQLQHSGIDILSLRARRMFGGYGIYFDDVMFALVADDELFFKVGPNNVKDYETRALEPFSYERSGKRYNMSYSAAPTEVFDDTDEMHHWASKAIDAAMIAHNQKQKKKNKK